MPSDTRGPASDSLGTALWRWVGLLAALTAVSVLHYTTSADRVWLHNIYQRLYYAPIVMGAYWFGVTGGVVTAAAAALAYFPHIQHTWGQNEPYAASQYVELVIFPCAGVLVGALADRQRMLTAQFRQAAESLEAANHELRTSQEHLRRADRLSALGEIAAGLAHEIRNPLAGIKGAIEIVGSRVPAGTPEAEFTGIATTELRRLDDLVGEFLAYARPRDPEFRVACVDDVIEHVMMLLRPEAERAGVTFACDGALNDHVRMDPEQIQQVLFNVALNGIQASPAGGTLRISTSLTGESATIAIADQGPGIPDDQRERLFDPFFTTKVNGTGLGLAVSQRIIHAHGGRITFAPGAPTGTTVHVVLPRRAGD